MWCIVLAGMLGAEPNAVAVSSPPSVVIGSQTPRGTLVVVGGGTTTCEIADKTIELAGGKSAKVAIIAEANPESGPGSMAMWQRTDAAKVSLIDVKQLALAKKIVGEADLIWMPGGLQGVFMNSINGTGLEEAVRERYRQGAVVAGTSAGAAVMSKVMIGGKSDLDSLKAGGAPILGPGLGLWPEAIVDQHFLQKGRFNRLVLATLDYPDLIGVGIDEETAAIVHGHEFEVIGENNITVVDARKASHEHLVKGEPAAARDLKVHILRAGMKFDLDN